MISKLKMKIAAMRLADAYKAWAVWLIVLVWATATFRDHFWLMSAQALLGTVGVYYGARALIRGPLRILGGVFLLLNGLVVGAFVTRLLLKMTAS
jgi:hypothetical protein